MADGITKVIDGFIWPASLSGEVRELRLEPVHGSNISLTARTLNFDLPDGWQVAETSLTPSLGNPREILSAATFPMVTGGDTCAHLPQVAMEALGPGDVLVSLQERWQVDGSFGPRPATFESLLGGITRGDAFECVDQSERADIGTLLWLPFRDGERGFYLIVVMGTGVSDETREQTVAILDSLDFGTEGYGSNRPLPTGRLDPLSSMPNVPTMRLSEARRYGIDWSLDIRPSRPAGREFAQERIEQGYMATPVLPVAQFSGVFLWRKFCTSCEGVVHWEQPHRLQCTA